MTLFSPGKIVLLWRGDGEEHKIRDRRLSQMEVIGQEDHVKEKLGSVGRLREECA